MTERGSHDEHSTSARAVVYTRPEVFELWKLPLPEMGPDDLLLEVELCGIDGSELHMFRGEIQTLNERAPVIFGDEIIGRVAEIGERAYARRGLAVGDRVTVEARWGCEECSTCRAGHYFLCEKNTANYGYGMISCDDPPALWGGYATHTYVPREARVIRIPEGMHPKTALVACSVLANGIRWTDVAGVGLGTTVAVIGPGPQGLACVLAAAQRGAEVVAVGLARDSARLEVAQALGAVATVAVGESDEPEATCEIVRSAVGNVDVVIEAAGPQAARELALELVRPAGKVVNVSIATPLLQTIDTRKLILKEITIFNPRSHAGTVERSFALAESLVRKAIDVGSLVTHVFPLEQAEEAVRVASYETDEVPVKVVLDPRR
jgi:threonine dehydrogenase-like Zn-dependent dehydrogenase